MKNLKLGLITLVILLNSNHICAQKFGEKFKQAWYRTMANLRPTPWVVGLGWNVVKDDGNPYKNFFHGKSLNVFPFLSSARCEKYIDKGWSAVFCFAYNNYKAGKLINSEVPSTSSSNFMSFDLNAKYNFCALYDINKKWFHSEKTILDLYSTFGFGFTYRNTARVKQVGTLNLGFGTNIWIYEGWGINLQSTAKFGLKAPFYKTPTNYLQFSFGVVHIFKIDRGRVSRYSLKAIM